MTGVQTCALPIYPIPRVDPRPDALQKLLNIKWSKYIPHTPTPKQYAAMMLTHVEELLYGGALGGGKFVGENDNILTPTGFKKNTELSVGDTILGADGKPQYIRQWKGWETLECYRVTFHDGTFLEVPLAHKWVAWRSGRSRKQNGKRLMGENSKQVVSTSKLIEWHKKASDTAGKVTQTPWVLIPVCAPCDISTPTPREIEPYLLGALLGDGYIGNVNADTVTLTCSAEDYENHWKHVLGNWSVSVDTKDDGNKTIRFIGDRRHGLVNILKKHGIYGTHSDTKFIPKELLVTPIEYRLSLLQGLIDTDGYVDSRGHVYYCSVSPRLRADVSWLVRSLGGVCTEFDDNELYIKLPEGIVPCRMPRKVERYKPHNCSLYRRVVSIEKVEAKRGRCITVSNPDGLYITNDFILTHNSDFLAYEALRYCDLPGFAAIIFRRQLTDLSQPGSLIPRIAQWLEPFKSSGECRYIGERHCWEFKTMYPGTDIPGPPALLQFGYIGDASIRERYQSAEYQLVCFDELGQWNTDVDWTFMGSRIRATVCPIHKKDGDNNPIWDDNCYICSSKRQIPLRKRAAMNPGPAWVKRRWQIVPDPSLYKSKREALIAIQEGQKIRWVGTHPEYKFIPASLDDNPHLDSKAYKKLLAGMTPDERSRLEDGNWEARKNARFKRKWIYNNYINLYDNGFAYINEDMSETVTLPYSSLKTIFTTTDSASTSKLFAVGDDDAIQAADQREGKQKKPSSTCIGVWGLTYDDRLLWLDYMRGFIELPQIIEELIRINLKWNPQFNKIECNGLGIGVAQFSEKAGLRVRKNVRKTDKLENSMSAQIMMSYGQIYFPMNAPWIETAEDLIFNWTGNPEEEDDTVDILSDAAIELTPRVAKKILMPNKKILLPHGVSSVGGSSGVPRWGLR